MTMPTAKLVITAAPGELDDVAGALKPRGSIDVQITAIEVVADEELLRHDLRPTLVTFVSAAAATDPPTELQGPLVRVHATAPEEQ